MTTLEKIQARLKQAMLSKNEAEKNALRMLLGRIQSAEALEGPASEEKVLGYINSQIKQTNSQISGTDEKTGKSWNLEGEARTKLEADIRLYEEFLPKYMTKEEILAVLSQEPTLSIIKTQAKVGGAKGIASKVFKDLKADVRGKDVSEVVETLWTPPTV